ncbi:MAG: YfhO family protein [Candidatus Coatesbacteria bacterium]|nr:YfhO family protein [Candidatus Coatesbacteria bacterium]
MMRKVGAASKPLLAQIGFLLALVLIFFGNALFSHKLYFYYDTIMQNFPFGQFFAEGFSQFKLRLWCPHIFSGFPLFAEGQAGALYPLFAPLLLLAPYWVIYKYSIAFHSLLAGVFMLMFLQQMRLRRQSCLFGAVAFAFSGFFVAQVSHTNIIRGYCYLPAILASIEVVRRRGMRRWWLIPVLFGTFLLGTHPYVAIYAILATALWLAFAWFEGTASDKQILRVRWLATIGGLIVGLGLAGCQLLPSAELLSHSTRGADFSVGFLTAGSLPLRNLITFLLPHFFGTPASDCYWGPGEIGLFAEFCCYVGILTLILAAVAVFFSRSKRLLYFLLLLAGGLLLALGNQTPLYAVVASVPILNATRTPARFVYLIVFALSSTSAFGLDHLLSTSVKKRKRLLANLFVIASVAVLSVIACHFALPNLKAVALERSQPPSSRELIDAESRAFFEDYSESLAEDLWRFTVAAVLSAVLLLCVINLPRTGQYVALGLPVLLFVDLLWFGYSFNPVASTEVYTRPHKITKLLQADSEMFRTLRWHVNELWRPRVNVGEGERRADPFTPGWANDLERYRDCTASQVPNTNMIYGIDSVDGYSSFGLSRYNRLLGAPGKGALPRFEPSTGLLSLLNVKYIISSEAISHERLAPVLTESDLHLYQYADYLPRAFLVDKAVVLPTQEHVLAAVADQSFWPLTGVLLDADQLRQAADFNVGSLVRQWSVRGVNAPSDIAIQGGAPGAVSVLEYDCQDAIFEVNANRAGFLVISENDFPGWKAYVNGEETPVLRAYGLVKAIAVAEGKSVVRLCFEPSSFRAGLLITLLSALIVSCMAFALGPSERAECQPGRDVCGGWGVTGRWLVVLIAASLVVVPYAVSRNDNASATGTLMFGDLIANAYCASATDALTRGDDEAAKRAAISAQAAAPKNVKAHYVQGVALFRLLDREGARSEWEQCLTLDPGYEPALQALNELGREFGD